MKHLIIIFSLLISVQGFGQLLPAFVSANKSRGSYINAPQLPPGEPGGQTFWQSADYYISSTATGTDNDTLSVSQFNSFSFSSGDSIAVLASDTIDPIIPPSSNIYIGVAGTGTKPVVSCSDEITNWTVHSGNIYKATFNTDIGQLFVDGERMKLARYPNTGYFTTTSTNTTTTVTSTGLDSGIDYTGATWFGRTTAWNIYSETVASSSSQTLTLSAARGGIATGEGFFLTNKLDFLDEAGEWYYDTSTNTVYLWMPDGSSPSTAEVRGSTSSYGIVVDTKDYVSIENLVINHADSVGIFIDNSDYAVIDSCDINYAEQFGVYIPNTGSSNATVTYSSITGSNRDGIHSYAARSNFSNNTIMDIAVLTSFHKLSGDYLGMGIYQRASNTSIEYNKIINTAYSSIHFYGQSTMVKYNLCDSAMQWLGDGGAIYTYNGTTYSDPASQYSEVKHNLVLNATGNRTGYTSNWDDGYGIYMDDRTHDVEIDSNLVANCNCGIYLHIAGAIDVRYNLIADCNAMVVTSGEEADSYVNHNILYAYDESDDFIWWQDDPQRFVKEDAASAVYDYNSYYNHYNTSNIFNNTGDWTSWQAGGDDANSTFDSTSLGAGETEVLFYNTEKTAQSQDLSGYTWRDLDGNTVTSLTLQPFTSQILIRE